MVGKLVKWLLFSVIVALLPLVFAWWSTFLSGPIKSFAQVVSRGELFIVSATVCAAAIGDLVGKSHRDQFTTVIAYITSGAAVVILMLSSLFYANIVNSAGSAAFAVATTSASFYIVAVVVGAVSIVLSEL